MNLCVIILVFALNIYPVAANPVTPYNLELLSARDGGTDGGNPLISPKTWIPIVVIIVLLSFIALMIWAKDSLQKAFSAFGGALGVHAGAPLNSNPVGRELTADQLVGTINDPPISGAARPTRRTRRPRRRPSQISVTSLPAYNKEPGEEELVIFRGRDMEDATMPVASHADEDDDSLNSQEQSSYPPMPTSANDMPLLHNDDPSGDLSLQSLPSPDANGHRPSFDSSLQETSSLMRADSNLPQGDSDPRGEAPPYFEVVDHTPEVNSEVPTTQSSSVPASTLPDPQRRRSGFRTFLNRMSMISHIPEHRRTDSNQSISTSNSHGREQSTSNHRASRSGSGSPFAPSMFRTISRQRSNQTLNSSVHLNSPSVISLNSISSPLSHTLIRTEFTYPKSGPTPEQLKVISSRENFSRFGVPYGADAIAFAASSSRQDLEPPPPDFEASSSQLSLARPSSSRLNPLANVADTQESRPSISEPRLAGERGERSGATQSMDVQSETVTNTSTTSITHTKSSASQSTYKVPNSNSLTDPSSSSSTLPHHLPPINVLSEFGTLYNASTAPQDATGFSNGGRSESRASNYSFQSYATAFESLGRERMGVDSGPPTPRLGDQHMMDDVVITTRG